MVVPFVMVCGKWMGLGGKAIYSCVYVAPRHSRESGNLLMLRVLLSMESFLRIRKMDGGLRFRGDDGVL